VWPDNSFKRRRFAARLKSGVSLRTKHCHSAETCDRIAGAVAVRNVAGILGLALASIASPAFALTVFISETFATAALVGSAALGLAGGGVTRIMKLPVWAGFAASAAVAALVALGHHFALRTLTHDVRLFDEVSDALAPAYIRLAVICGVILGVACLVGYRIAKRWQR
jgi:hypothetical protein